MGGGYAILGEGYAIWIHENVPSELCDYKVHCFNGEPKLVLVCSDRYSDTGLKEDFYTVDWTHTNIRRLEHPNATLNRKKPKNLEKMIELAGRLSDKTYFSRIDFYELNGALLFGEFTLYPSSGFKKFDPDLCDYEIGTWLALDKTN